MSGDNPVVHFEMPYEDAKRLVDFYKAAFDWDMDITDDPMGNYVIATTSPTENRRPTMPGTINGGFFPRKADSPAQNPSVVIGVKDIAAAMEKVNQAGGKVMGEPMDIPGIGMYVSFNDSEGNLVSLLQAKTQ